MKIILSSECIDPTYEHVHHAKICELLEQSRIEFFNSRGISINEMISSGILPVLSELSLSFLRELKLGEYYIECRDPEVTDKVFKTTQVILNQKRKVCVSADVTIKFLHKDKKRAGVFPYRDKFTS